jgi:hypothetical protein
LLRGDSEITGKEWNLSPDVCPAYITFFRVLDVFLFGGLKVLKKYLLKDDNEDRETDHILRIFRAYEGVTTSMMIQGSWEKAGFSYHQRDGTFYLAVDEGRIRGRQTFAKFGRGTIPSRPYRPRGGIRNGDG